MTPLRGLWKDCDEWDRRYQTEIDRTNMRSTEGGRRTRVSPENRDVPGAAPTAPGPADTPVLFDEEEGDVST